jgi:hypothetical protein
VKLAKEVGEMYQSIKEGLDRTPEGLMGELDSRCQWLARSAEIKADAEAILDQKMGEVAESFVGLEESYSTIKLMVLGRCREEKRLFTLSERLNRTITHQIDAIRSLLSYGKQELANSKWQSDGRGGWVKEKRPMTAEHDPAEAPHFPQRGGSNAS